MKLARLFYSTITIAWALLLPHAALPISVEIYEYEIFNDVCGLGNGRMEAHVIGGTPPYTYQWSNGSILPVNSGLSAGTYSVTVTDAEGGQATAQGTVEASNLTPVASSMVVSSPGYPDPYCGGALPGPFFRMRIYDHERWHWGLPMEQTSPVINFNGSPITPVHTSSFPNGAPWFSSDEYSFLEYYVPITGSCNGPGVEFTVVMPGGCSGTVVAYPGCPLEWPEVTLLEATPSCTNLNTGSLRLQVEASTHYTMWADGLFVAHDQAPFEVFNFTGLSAGTKFITYSIGGASLYWTQSCPGPTYEFVVPSNGIQCGTVQGTAFMDYNLNCTKQSTEPGLPSATLLIEPGPIYTTTGGSGTYAVNLLPGSYTVTQLSTVADEHCTGTPQAFTISGGTTATRNFPDTSLVALDVRIQASAGAARPGFELRYALSTRNLSPAQSGAITVSMEFDPVLDFLSATPAPSTVAGNTLTWNQAQLTGFQNRGIQLNFQVPPDVGLLGYQLVATASVSTANTDGNLANNTVTVLRTITGAYDPNDKLAYTSSGNTDVWQINEDEWIDYTIRFQNTGTDTAFHVLITDTLPAILDPGSIEIGASSHNFTWQLRDAGTLKFYFMNILLPDSNINEPLSHGFVGFRIRPRLPLLPGDEIENIANIYFDFNPPVITEPSVLTVPLPGVLVSPRVLLDGPYVEAAQRMNDGLRTAGLVPLAEPYTALGYTHMGGGGETTSPGVVAITGDNAVVDWVVVELRSTNAPHGVVATRSALLKRNGDVTSTNGIDPVAFNVAAGDYRVAVQHRNHLACMTNAAIELGSTTTLVDLSVSSTATYGTDARKQVGTRMVLWSGDVRFNGDVKYTGANNDRDAVLLRVGGSTPTNVVSGYYMEDVNMDGDVKYTGTGNDRDVILQTIGGVVPTAVRVEQLP